MQQDAEECLSAFLTTFSSTLRQGGADIIRDMFGIEFKETFPPADPIQLLQSHARWV